MAAGYVESWVEVDCHTFIESTWIAGHVGVVAPTSFVMRLGRFTCSTIGFIIITMETARR